MTAIADLVETQTTQDLGMLSTAVFDRRFKDEAGKFVYRYSLTRTWIGARLRKLVFLMLNPSTADAFIVDPTVRRCMIWAQEWGYGVLEVVNLFSYRATKPAKMKKAQDPVGPLNDHFILEACRSAELVVGAWGAHGHLLGRGRYVANELLKDRALTCFSTVKNGHPEHPLYIKGTSRPGPFKLN